MWAAVGKEAEQGEHRAGVERAVFRLINLI